MYQQMLHTRRKFLAHTINHVVGCKIISGRAAADLYAQILGFKNNNELHHLISKNDPKAQSKVLNDWSDKDAQVFHICKQYAPDVTQEMFNQICTLSKPQYFDRYADWRPTLIKLLKQVENIQFLRYRNNIELCDGVSYLLIYLADGQVHNNKAKNRLFIIFNVLSDLAETGRISAIRWCDVAALYRENNFEELVSKIFFEDENFIKNYAFLEQIENYATKDLSTYREHSIAAEKFQELFVKLGVDMKNLTLSSDLEKAISS